MNQRYLLALDQGTTSSRAVLFTKEGQVVASEAFEFPQHYPQPGWVEHDPQDILTTQIEALRKRIADTLDMEIRSASELLKGGNDIPDGFDFVQAIGITQD